MPDNSNTVSLQSSKQELLDEIAYLRENQAEAEAAAKFKQELHQTLSGAINIGYWEWDEIENRAVYLYE
jgi:hypothetical protein